MEKINLNFNKIIKNNLYLILLIFLLFLTILITNFYSINKKNNKNNLLNFLDNSYLKKSLNLIVDNLNPKFSYINFEVQKGDTFEKIIKQLNLPSNEKELIIKKLSKHKFVNKLYKNQKITFKLNNSRPIKVEEILIEKSKTKTLVFNRKKESNEFVQKEINKNLDQVVVYKESIITNSLYSSAISVGIEPNIIIDFAMIYGFQVDFQRDIWKNDSFQIVYETFLDENNKVLETGNIIYANLILQGREYPLYIYKLKTRYDHFDQFGKSSRKSLMKTPINGARLSSPFGMRKHPILGFNKMHRGTDFAAPTGTPIMASGTGTVIKAGWCGKGGKCVRIRHNSSYTTGYGHMSKIATRTGRRVRQGQIIGYVGSTGMSTGPHLHYTVSYNGKFINSQKLKLPSGKILKDNERKIFEVERIKVDVKLAELKNYKK